MPLDKTILSVVVAAIERFRNQHSPVEQFVVVIGSILTPVYFIQGKVATLLFGIQAMANGKDISLIALTVLCIQTILVFYNLGLLVNFFLASNTGNQSKFAKKYIGSHPALSFTIIPTHLLSPEVEPVENTSPMEEEFALNIPTLEEFLTSEEALPAGITPASDLISFYEKLYADELEVVEPEHKTQSMADMIRAKGADIDQLLKEI